MDDSVWSGRSLQETVNTIRRAVPNAEITTAAFVTRVASTASVDIVYYRSALTANAVAEGCGDAVSNRVQIVCPGPDFSSKPMLSSEVNLAAWRRCEGMA